MSRKNKKKKEQRSSLAVKIKGDMRDIHFASGGTPRQWRGSSATHKDKRLKRQDRSTVKNESIKNSDE